MFFCLCPHLGKFDRLHCFCRFALLFSSVYTMDHDMVDGWEAQGSFERGLAVWYLKKNAGAA